MRKWLVLSFINLIVFQLYSQTERSISGIVIDSTGKTIESANIRIMNTSITTTSNNKGVFNLIIKDDKEFVVCISHLNFREKEIKIDPQKIANNFVVTLDYKDFEINEVLISDQKNRENGLVRIEPKLLNNIPSISGDNVQSLIKTMPGVASNNELSSNYSVRGGNFDENLVYINGIEIFRPVLLQSGQQEGMSIANSDFVSKIEFSSGGFSCIYDDKMSSVLDIRYKQPDKFKAGIEIGLLGASMFIQGKIYNRLKYLGGIRYKNSQYLLKTLETKGEYKPNFIDFQSLLSYEVNSTLKINLLAYYSGNKYLFFPEDRTTSFGTINEAVSLYIDFDGQERDKFNSLLGDFTIDYRPSSKFGMKISSSIYNNDEALTYDIEGRYSLNQLDKEIGSSTFGDSILNLGIGKFIDHARSYYHAEIYNIRKNGWWNSEQLTLQWGLKYQHESVHYNVNEWQMVDSAGYSIPYTNNEIQLTQSWYSNNSADINRFSIFLHSIYHPLENRNWNIESGLRYHFSDLNKEHLVSPRISFGLYPGSKRNLYLRFGGGIYYQSIAFREIIDRIGTIHPETRTPLSLQFNLSGDLNFKMMERPFHIRSEVFYKDLKKMIPYSVDNIRNIYYPQKNGNGFSYGIDFRLNGEFVKDVESWLSLSLMKSGMQIDGDTTGMQSLPNDHLINVSLYFQDYFPGNKRIKMFMALYYLSGQPFGPPNNETYYAPLRMPAYRRVDLGFSLDLIKKDENQAQLLKKTFKDFMVYIEIFNLLGINNTVSYNWVTIVPNPSLIAESQYSMFAVPNRLSARRLNLRLLMTF